MPTYEYECNSCGTLFELRRSIKDAEAKAACPVCGLDECKRVISSFAMAAPSSAGGGCGGGASRFT